MKKTLNACVAGLTLLMALPAMAADWAPRKPVEMIAAGGAGGGTDQFTRQVQAAIQKNSLNKTNMVVVNKGGGSGAEAFIYDKSYPGDDSKLIFGTNNEWLLPMVTKLGFKPDELTPVAAMAFDEFIVWVQTDAPYKTITDLIDAAKANPGSVKFGGSQSKDTDQVLVRKIEEATGAKLPYVPFKSGSEAAVQLAGKHIDANVNNPSEMVGQWGANQVRPLCVMSPDHLDNTTKVSGDMAWSDIPTCKEQGLAIESYRMPRTVYLPGNVAPEVVAYYADLMKKVFETAEYKNYITTTSQTAQFLNAEELKAYAAKESADDTAQFKKDGWLVE